MVRLISITGISELIGSETIGRDRCVISVFRLETKCLDLPLHLGHLFAHVQNDFDARQIHAQVARQLENHFQPLQIVVGVEARVAVAARGLEQSFALIEPQRLRMDLILLGDRRNHVGGFASSP